jgi:hypothetical protein
MDSFHVLRRVRLYFHGKSHRQCCRLFLSRFCCCCCCGCCSDQILRSDMETINVRQQHLLLASELTVFRSMHQLSDMIVEDRFRMQDRLTALEERVRVCEEERK